RDARPAGGADRRPGLRRPDGPHRPLARRDGPPRVGPGGAVLRPARRRPRRTWHPVGGQHMTPFNFWISALTIVVVLVVVLHVVAYMILVERKVSAWMQDRYGPNRVGPYGLLQPIVDGAKMFFKEDIIPTHVDKIFYLVAPCVATGTALLAFAVIPFGPTHPNHPERYQFVIAPNIDIGILWVFAVSSLAVYGIILGGWSSNNKYSILGSLRSSAQIISYEIPLGMSILGIVLYSGSLNLERII